MARHRGFTLLELLIVIAILAVLAVLASSGVVRGLAMADSVECQNNLSQIVIGVKEWGRVHEGRILPAVARTDDGTVPWFYLLAKDNYVNAPNSANAPDEAPLAVQNPFMCPAATNALVTPNVSPYSPVAPEARGWMREGTAKFKIDCSYFWNGVDDTGADALKEWPSVQADLTEDDWKHQLNGFTRMRGSGEHLVMIADGVGIDAADNPFRVAARHDDGATTNAAFYDGHVGLIRRQQANDWADDPIIGAGPNMQRDGPPYFRLDDVD